MYFWSRRFQHAVFPCDLPFPEVLRSPKEPLSRRRAARFRVNQKAMCIVNEFVAAYSFFELGCPSDASWEPKLGPARSRPLVRKLADGLLSQVRHFVRSGVSSPGSLDGGLLSVHECLRSFSVSMYGSKFDSDTSLQRAAAEFVDVDRLALPTKAGLVNPCDYLDGEELETYMHPERSLLPENAWGQIPRPCHKVKKEDEAIIQAKLLQAGMALLVSHRYLPKDPRFGRGRRPLVGGLFGLSKKVSPEQAAQKRKAKQKVKQRLIFDRRPINCTERRFGWAHLPSGAQFCHARLARNQVLRGSGKDLSNYYFNLAHQPAWIPRQAFGRPAGREVRKRFGNLAVPLGAPAEGGPYFLCLRVAGMGDLNAVDLGQRVHERVLEAFGVLDPSKRLRYGMALPEGPIWVGIYIDDLLVTAVVLRTAAGARGADTVLCEKASAAYVDAELPEAQDKAFNSLLNFKAWGAEIRGGRGTVSGPTEARLRMWIVVSKIVSLGWSTRKILEIILGMFAVLFIYRRPFFSFLHHVYVFVARLEPGQWVRLPAFICDELRVCAAHLAVAYSDMRASLSTTLAATDASSTGFGSTKAEISLRLAERLYRRVEQRGCPVRLDEDPRYDDCANRLMQPSSDVDVLGKCLDWKVDLQGTFRRPGHINLLEARTIKYTVRDLAREAGEREVIAAGTHLLLCDSQVCVGSLGKGRSSSFKLNGIWRSMVGYLVLAQMWLGLLWVSTGCNPADYPSRARSLPAPEKPPGWVNDLMGRIRRRWDGLEVFAGGGTFLHGLVVGWGSEWRKHWISRTGYIMIFFLSSCRAKYEK